MRLRIDMSDVKFYYFDGRGRGEATRWMLAACGIEYDEVFTSTKEFYRKLVTDGKLLYHQVPMLEIDGMQLTQTGAILRYLARKGNMYGSDSKEQALIDMYMEGVQDMHHGVLFLPFQKTPEEKKSMWEEWKVKLFGRYFPAFEKVISESKNSHMTGGDNMSIADVLLVMALLRVLELEDNVLDGFPVLKKWLEEQKKIPWISKFLEPGNKRKSPPDAKFVSTVTSVLFS